MLICAPTGAGKTNVAMLCMLHEIGMHRSAATGEVDLEALSATYAEVRGRHVRAAEERRVRATRERE